MNLLSISKRSRCCILLEKANIARKITGMCPEDVLLKNLELLESRKMFDKIRSFPGDIQAALMQKEETLRYVLELMKPDIPINRIVQVLEQMPPEDLVKLAPEDVCRVLSCQQVKNDYMGIYLRYYREDGLGSEVLSNLWKGLDWFRKRRKNLTDEWLESIGRKRSIFKEPAIADNFIRWISDYDSCLQMLVQRDDVVSLLNSLCQADRFGCRLDEISLEELCSETEHLSGLWNWARRFMKEQQLARFLPLWLGNHALVYDLECLKRKAESGKKIDMESFLAGRASYTAFLYNEEFSEELGREHEELVIYAITHKKRAFLRLVRENINLYRNIPTCSVLFCRKFYDKCLNINTMNRRNLDACREMMCNFEIAWELLEQREHTFEELALIYSLPVEYIQLYESFSARRTDERLRVMREIVKNHCLAKGLVTEELSKNLMIKPLSQWIQQDFRHIQDLSHENAVRMLGRREELARFIPDMKSNAEVRYVLDNLAQCREFASMEKIRENSLECNEEWKYLKNMFAFSDEFVEENRERIRQFIFEDGVHIMKTYCESQQEKRDELRRLLSAELMGRFKELKYYHDDLSREIDYPVTDRQKKVWMENTKETQEDLAVWEEDGLLPVMQMGVKPYATCLSYVDGKYRQCLLACHDSNKKVLYLSYKGKIVLRAALRLTKGAYCKTAGNKKPQIQFADFMADDEGKPTDNVESTQEYLTLFLERAYVSELPRQMMRSAYQLMLRLVKRKARGLNALLTVSPSYQDSLGNELVPSYYSMYISKSKAGEQYLDSLGGNKCVEAECSYKREKFLIDRTSA